MVASYSRGSTTLKRPSFSAKCEGRPVVIILRVNVGRVVEQHMYSIDVALNDATCSRVQPALLFDFHIFYVTVYFASPLKTT